jgi:WD40 repeat protein
MATTTDGDLAADVGPGKFEYDLFVSYRRKDGRPFADWLRRQLLNYRLPRSFGERRKTRLRIYQDIAYERATEDFWSSTIVPALVQSRYLCLVATPATLEVQNDGGPNFLAREIETFIVTPQGKNLFVLRAIGEIGDPLPANLSAQYPNVEEVDVRDRGSLWRRIRGYRKLRDAVLTISATLLDVRPSDMPRLREEEERRRARFAWSVAGGAVMLLAIVSVLAFGWLSQRNEAMKQRREAERQRNEATRRLADAFALQAARARLEDNYLAARVYLTASREQALTPRGLLEGLALSVNPAVFIRDLNAPGDRESAPVFSPANDLLAIAGADGFVRILDTTTWHQRARFGPHGAPVSALAFSGDGNVLAVGLGDERRTEVDPSSVSVQLWNVRKGTRGARLQAPGYAAELRTVAANADGTRIAAAANELFVWDARSGAIQFQELRAGAVHVEFNHDGSLLAYTSFRPGLKVLRVPAFTPIESGFLGGPVPPGVFGNPPAAFSPRSGDLVVGSTTGQLTSVKLPGGQPRNVAAHQTSVNSIAFSQDGRLMASAGSDRVVLLWDACNERVIARLDAHQSAVFSVSLDRRGAQLVSTELDTTPNGRWFGRSRLWELRRRIASPRAEIATEPILTFFRPGGGFVLVKLSDTKRVEFVDVGSGGARTVWAIPRGAQMRTLDVSADGRWLALALDHVPPPETHRLPETRVEVIDTMSGKRKASIQVPGNQFEIASVAVSADGTRVALGAQEAFVWDVSSGRLLMHQGHGDPVTIAFGRNASEVIWTEEGHIVLFNIASTQRREFAFEKSFPPQAIAISGNGAVIAAAFQDRSVVLWHTSSNVLAATFSTGIGYCPAPQSEGRVPYDIESGPRRLMFNADGSQLAGLIADQVEIWGADVPASLAEAVRDSGSCWTGTELITCRSSERPSR